ncbi:ribosome-binding factor A [Patescibacteria group bacterium]
MKHRPSKTAQIIRSSLASTLSKFRRNNELYTITNIEISPDLKIANIWISNASNEKWSIDKIKQYLPEFIIGLKNTKLKHIPKLRFQKDESGQYTEKIDKIFHKINES